MRICMHCKSELPDNTRFCGHCGQRFISSEDPSTGNSITRSSDILSFDPQRTLADGNITFISANNEEKTFISSPHNTPDIPHTPYASHAPNTPIPEVRQDEDMEHEILHSYDGWDEEHAITAPLANATSPRKDEEEEEKDVLLPFPFMPNNTPSLSSGNVLAQGPLHIDQVPYGGHPHIPAAAQPTPMTPPATPHPVQLFQSAPARLSAVVSPSRSYNPFKRQHAPSQHHNPLKHHRPHHPLKHHAMRPPCLVVVVTAFIGICILAIIFFTHLAKPPHLTPIAQLVGVPIPGQKMILHGGNFEPGEIVTAVIDKQPTASNSSFFSNAMQMGGLLLQKTVTPAGIKGIVNGDGTFSLTITVDPSWPVGSIHTVYVYKQDGTFIKLPPFVVVNSTTPTQVGLQNCLDETGTIKLGPVQEGSAGPISKTVTLCTQATNPVKWTAQSNQKWLQFPSSGQVQAPGGNLSIKASAKGLRAGAYNTTLLFNSPQNTAPVTLSVVLVVIKAPPSSPPPSTGPPPAVTCVGVTPQVISFTNVANQYTLLSKNVSLNNCGSDGKWSASITNSSGKPWLSVGPAQGPIPSGWFQGVAITVSSAALSPGTYSSKVTFHIGSSSADLTVLFTVNPQKTLISCIDASPQLFAFSGIAGQNDVQVRKLKLSNCGVAGQWSLSTQTDNGIGWLQASTYSHALKVGEAQEITIAVSSAYLNEGVHYAQLIVSLGSSSVKVIVTFDVRETCFKVDYRSLLFKLHVGDSPVQDTLNLTNCSDQRIGPEIWYGSASTVDGANWLTLDRTSSRLAAKSSQHVAVDVSIANMHAGIYTGNVLFIMGSHRITVRVKLIIMDTPTEENCIKTDTGSLDFFSYQFSNPDSQEVDVENCAKTTEDWTVTSNAPDWLHADPVKGTLNVNDDKDVRVRVTSEHLDAGDRTGILTFRSGASTRQVIVHLTIAPLPCITADPKSLTFSSTINESGQASQPSAQTVKVKNCGGAGSLSTSTTTHDGASWLGVTLPTAHLDVNQVIEVPFAVDSSDLSPGSYSATIPFTITVRGGAQATAYVNVSFSIAQPPVLCTANPSTLNFVSDWGQLTPSSKNVTLSGCGPNATWTETDGSDGLFYVDPGSGTFDNNNGGSQVVRIEPDSYPSETGVYTYTLTFTSSSGKMATVTATWKINPPSNPTCIQADSGPLSFSDQDEITSGDVSFSNCGAYPGNIAVSADSSWLNISSGGSTAIDGSSTFSTGSGPTVAANADSTNLKPGHYNGTIKATITTPQGSKSVALNVVYIVPLPVVPPTPTPIVTPTATPTDTPGITPSDTSGVTPTDTPGVTPSNTTGSTPTDTPGITPTDTPGITPTDTSGVTPTATPCVILPTAAPGMTPTPIPCFTPTDTPGVTPTDTPGVTPTDTPTPTPVPVVPTDTPTPTPVPVVPTDTPTPTPVPVVPTDTPTPTPTPPPVTPTDTPTPGP